MAPLFPHETRKKTMLHDLFIHGAAIGTHALSGLAALVIGISQLVLPKGKVRHRLMGWLWVSLMGYLAVSSLFIQSYRMLGPFSVLHVLSILVMVGLVFLVREAKRGDVREHKKTAFLLFWGGLFLAGGWAFVPGRHMHDVVFQ